MKTSVAIDDVGRMVLPKEIREAIGVFGRTAVQVEVVGDSARITSKEVPKGTMKLRGGRPVYAGQLPKDWDSGAEVLKARERRLRR